MILYSVKQDYETANSYKTFDAFQLAIDLGDYLDRWDCEYDGNSTKILEKLLNMKAGNSTCFYDITVTAI